MQQVRRAVGSLDEGREGGESCLVCNLVSRNLVSYIGQNLQKPCKWMQAQRTTFLSLLPTVIWGNIREDGRSDVHPEIWTG